MARSSFTSRDYSLLAPPDIRVAWLGNGGIPFHQSRKNRVQQVPPGFLLDAGLWLGLLSGPSSTFALGLGGGWGGGGGGVGGGGGCPGAGARHLGSGLEHVAMRFIVPASLAAGSRA